MNWKITPFFENQIKVLSKTYRHVEGDFSEFQSVCHRALGIDLGRGVYKFRWKNSSIPTGKRGGFRILVKMFGDVCVPLIIYSKTHLENVSETDILEALKTSLDQL